MNEQNSLLATAHSLITFVIPTGKEPSGEWRRKGCIHFLLNCRLKNLSSYWRKNRVCVLNGLFRLDRLRRLLASAPLALSLTTLLIGFAAMMPRDIRPLMPALRSGWLQAHVATGILAYGALAVSAVLALIMLTTRDERVETVASDWLGKYWRIPSLAALEKYVHSLIVFGFIFLSLLIVTGAVWAEETWGRWWGWDPKEIWALITWLIYLVYLHGRNRFGWRGQATAWFSAVGFAAVMFTLFGVTYLLPGLHSYK